MSKQDPNIKAKRDTTSQSDATKGPGEQEQPDRQEKGRAFDQGLYNNSNTQAGTAQSGYDEANPKQPGGKQQQQPKVTNQENAITNSEEQNKWEDEPVEEKSGGNSTETTDPEIVPDEEKTVKKIPTMKGGAI